MPLDRAIWSHLKRRFCGTIADIQYDSTAHTAVVNFEKPQAAKTALMLNGGTLDGATISVTSDSVSDEHHDADPVYGAPDTAPEGTDGYEQHDKPRAGIVAELLAKGYVLSEQILHKAIEVDQNQVRDSLSVFFKSYRPLIFSFPGNFCSFLELYQRTR
jgi:hypothetical protein